MWTHYRPWTRDHEVDVVELGARVAYDYDEAFTVAYKIGAALGLPRRLVPLDWQRAFVRVGRSSSGAWWGLG